MILRILRKMLVLLLLAITSAVAQQCPQQYARFSPQHSYCLPPNPTCAVVYKGVSNEDRNVILQVHNNYRSKVATGKEGQAGGLPTAGDMIEMEWDAELEAVAQKWAAQCNFNHDCPECREIENFAVNQNMAYEDVPCYDNECTKPNWKGVIDTLYDEVKFFNKQSVKNFYPDERYGHFSQCVWAKTWKIGCGYVAFKNGYHLRKLYACNYGPGGNYPNEPMYKAGKPLSLCPSNTQGSFYPGLCKVINVNQGPVYETPKQNSLIDCNWRKGEPTCNFNVDGQRNWKIKPSLGGYYLTILLRGGEKSSLKLMSSINPKSNSFCLVVVFRKTTTNAKQMDSSNILLDFDMGTGTSQMTLSSQSVQFVPYRINLSWNLKTKVTFNFSVPPNAPDHIIDIKEISAYDGNCAQNHYV